MNLRRSIAIVILATSLAGCGVVELISNGLAYTKAVETDLEHATGIKPEVGFNWHNGSLETVTVTSKGARRRSRSIAGLDRACSIC